VTREEIKNLILRRAYAGAFEEGIDDTFNLHTYAAENRIDNDEAWKAFEELKNEGLIDYHACGGMIINTSRGLMYAEQHKLADETLIDKQNKIRTKLLVTLADIQERSLHGEITYWATWINEAGVSEQDFQNNDRLLRELGLVNNESVYEYEITSAGMEVIRDYRKRKKRLEDFEILEKLEGVTEQQRGHKFEDLLGEIIKEEGWEVDKRVRVTGEEIDIIIQRGLEYYLISCKWEKKPTQSEELDIMYSRAMDRSNLKGSIIMSMTGFMDSCIKKAIGKMGNCHLVMFGPIDINKIIHNENSFSDLLQEKYNEVMLHRCILLDGEIRDVKPI